MGLIKKWLEVGLTGLQDSLHRLDPMAAGIGSSSNHDTETDLAVEDERIGERCTTQTPNTGGTWVWLIHICQIIIQTFAVKTTDKDRNQK